MSSKWEWNRNPPLPLKLWYSAHLSKGQACRDEGSHLPKCTLAIPSLTCMCRNTHGARLLIYKLPEAHYICLWYNFKRMYSFYTKFHNPLCLPKYIFIAIKYIIISFIKERPKKATLIYIVHWILERLQDPF